MLLDMQNTHCAPLIPFDLSADETFAHLTDPDAAYLHLDHRLCELLRLDLFTSAFVSTSSTASSDCSIIPASTVPIASEFTENAALTFISSDLFASSTASLKEAMRTSTASSKLSTEGLPNTTPPAFQGKFSICLLRSVNGHAPFTTFSIEPAETFPNKKLATSNTVRSFFDMYPEFYALV